MRPKSIVWIAAAVLAVAQFSFGADVVAWGSAVNGVRLGVGFDPAPSEPGLRVLLQNVGASTLDILVGHQTGKGTAVVFKFIATAPDGNEHEGFDINSFTPIAGLLVPAVVRLDPGVIHEMHLALKKIICVEKPGDITFETLMKQRYTVHVSLEVDDKSVRWAGLLHPWIGKAMSGALLPPK